jgi:catechol 2,3-dioxygenase
VSIDPATVVEAAHLTVADLDRSIRFYEERVGLRTAWRRGDDAGLGAGGADLLVLHASPTAPRPARTTGLYHVAILVPSRPDLGRVLQHLAETRTPLQGFADHLVSEAIYLADPDGNGLEIYRDRPRAEWPMDNGRIRMASDPLDVDSLLADARRDGAPELPPDTRVGHIHLHVARLDEAERFYTTGLGFDLVTRYGGTASFMSAGGYHHHVAVNTWAGVGAPRPPEGAIGLRQFVVRVSRPDEVARVAARLRDAGYTADVAPDSLTTADPSGNRVVVSAAVQHR